MSAVAAVAHLLETLDLEQLERDRFRGISQANSWGRVYGGQVLGQALVAANRTVDTGRTAHSLHGYFLLAGDPANPIDYEVERLRDGGSFTTRRVTARQSGQSIFAMIASFHKHEPGFTHQTDMPDVPGPDDLPAMSEVLTRPGSRAPKTMQGYYAKERPIEIRLVGTERYFGTEGLEPRQCFWFKVREPLPESVGLHQAILAYASDFAILDTSLIAHGKLMFDPHMQLASLDHALWLHRPFRTDDWLLYVLESPTAGFARGFSRGAFYTQDGQLVASVAQEGLVRERTTSFVLK
jgi:acyl-CoA thioesterase II